MKIFKLLKRDLKIRIIFYIFVRMKEIIFYKKGLLLLVTLVLLAYFKFLMLIAN